MTTHRSLRLGLLALCVTAPAAACGEPFGIVGTGGSGTTSSSSGSTSSTGSMGGSGGTGGTMSSSSGTTATGGTGGASSSSTSASSSGSCDSTDPDGDGVTGCQGDCNNNDGSVFPGHAEICGDNKDNDCNSTVDDNCIGLGTFVSNTGNDSNPGTMSAPVATIGKGIQNALAIKAAGGNGSVVYVAGGHYSENVVLVEGVSLSGGYDPATWQRNPAMYDTAILAQGPDGVFVPNTVTRKTAIDGFRLQGKADAVNTSALQPYGAALTINGGTPTISGNVINAPAESSGARSVGVLLLAPSNDPQGALITKNRINGGNSGATVCEDSIGVAIASAGWPPPAPGAAAEITKNQIRAGNCKNAHGVLSYAQADQTLLFDNDISAGGASTGEAWGILVGHNPLDAEVIIDRNRINVDQSIVAGCNLSAGSITSWCGGIQSESAKARITNNIVFGAKALRSAAVWLNSPEVAPVSLALNGNYLDGGGATNIAGMSAAVSLTLGVGTNGVVGRIRNNILAGGVATVRYGVYEDSPLGKVLHPEKLENNDFFITITGGNAFYRFWDGTTIATKYTTIDPVNALQGSQLNFDGDPGLDATFHLTSLASICVDKGTSAEAPARDIDGQPRPNGPAVDVGPDEK